MGIYLRCVFILFRLCLRKWCCPGSFDFQSKCQVRFFHDPVIFRCHLYRHPAHAIYIDLRPCMSVFSARRARPQSVFSGNVDLIPVFFIFYVFGCDQITFHISGWNPIIPEHQCRCCCIVDAVPDLRLCKEILCKISCSTINICGSAVSHIFFQIRAYS